MLSMRTCLRCLARTWLVGAVMSARGLQHLGHLYALNPGLAALYEDPAALLRTRTRYMRHTHTHPHWVPLFAGIMLSLEAQAANGRLSPEAVDALQNTIASTFSALGDSLFSGTLLATWAFSSILLLWQGYMELAFACTLLLFLGLMAFRVIGFFAGLRHGVAILQGVKRLDCINWSYRLKLVNAVLLALALRLFWPAETPMIWLFGILACFLGGGALTRLHVPRLLVCAVFLGILGFGAQALHVHTYRIIP